VERGRIERRNPFQDGATPEVEIAGATDQDTVDLLTLHD
jgi:hypothetical protein